MAPRFGFPLLALLMPTACIIPDTEIEFVGGPANPGAVRLVERAPTDPQMFDLCNPDDEDPDASYPAFCPHVPRTQPSGLIEGVDGPLCVCAGSDARAIRPFDIYAEDPDRPADSLRAVLLLDPDSTSSTPLNFVAYQNFWAPGDIGERIGELNEVVQTDGQLDRTLTSEARDPPVLWRFRIEDTFGAETLDLCNNNNGRSLSPGLHTLQIMVTDRPFFDPNRSTTSSSCVQCGVPDLSVGATYATRHFVFECEDGVNDSGADCACGAPES